MSSLLRKPQAGASSQLKPRSDVGVGRLRWPPRLMSSWLHGSWLMALALGSCSCSWLTLLAPAHPMALGSCSALPIHLGAILEPLARLCMRTRFGGLESGRTSTDARAPEGDATWR